MSPPEVAFAQSSFKPNTQKFTNQPLGMNNKQMKKMGKRTDFSQINKHFKMQIQILKHNRKNQTQIFRIQIFKTRVFRTINTINQYFKITTQMDTTSNTMGGVNLFSGIVTEALRKFSKIFQQI